MSAGGGEGDLNLTPMLDLFSTLICFLLLTAAYFQLEALSTNVENVTSSDSPANPDDQKKKAQLVLTLLSKEIQLAEDEKSTTYPLQLDDKGRIVLESLTPKLEEWRNKYPERKDIVLNSENSVPYKHMITTFDYLVGKGWPDVGVNVQ